MIMQFILLIRYIWKILKSDFTCLVYNEMKSKFRKSKYTDKERILEIKLNP